MAVGALFGSVKIMYGAVASRKREMATLRAMGYAPLPLALSVVIEILVLALLGDPRVRSPPPDGRSSAAPASDQRA